MWRRGALFRVARITRLNRLWIEQCLAVRWLDRHKPRIEILDKLKGAVNGFWLVREPPKLVNNRRKRPLHAPAQACNDNTSLMVSRCAHEQAWLVRTPKSHFYALFNKFDRYRAPRVIISPKFEAQMHQFCALRAGERGQLAARCLERQIDYRFQPELRDKRKVLRLEKHRPVYSRMNARKLTGRFNWRRQLKEPLAGTWMCATLRNSGLDTPLLPPRRRRRAVSSMARPCSCVFARRTSRARLCGYVRGAYVRKQRSWPANAGAGLPFNQLSDLQRPPPPQHFFSPVLLGTQPRPSSPNEGPLSARASALGTAVWRLRPGFGATRASAR